MPVESVEMLLEEALRVLAPGVIELELELPCLDLSLQSRRRTRNRVVHEAAAAVREAGLGLKAATVTPEGHHDVGSPNRILREEIGGRVIVRMILAAAALLGHAGGEAEDAGRAIREAALEAVADGVRTADLGGDSPTDAFTNEVIRRARTKLEVWSAL